MGWTLVGGGIREVSEYAEREAPLVTGHLNAHRGATRYVLVVHHGEPSLHGIG